VRHLDDADRRAGALDIALAGVTGFITAIGWLSLAGVFLGPQSGNVVVASVAAGERNPQTFIAHGVPVIVFFAALVVGYVATFRARSRAGWAPWRIEVAVLSTEAGLLATAGVLGAVWEEQDVGLPPHSFAGLVTAGLAIAAIGLQSSAVRPVLGERVNTIATTGLLIGTARDLAMRLEQGPEAGGGVRGGLRTRSAMLASYSTAGVLARDRLSG
jgi:uncharacterized membrane protein YoaK (UPF0700 family)